MRAMSIVKYKRVCAKSSGEYKQRQTTTWRGRDQEGRSIEMKLYEVRYYCVPARHWLTYDVLQSGEMVVRRPYT